MEVRGTMDDTFDLRRAARYLGIHPQTLRKLALRGAVRGFRLNPRGHWRFRREWLDEFTRTSSRAHPGPWRRRDLPGQQLFPGWEDDIPQPLVD